MKRIISPSISIRILGPHPRLNLAKIMRDIGVDPYGIKIMLPKADMYLVHIRAVSNAVANILKQEMLSLGGDTAIARGALTGEVKKTGCLIMGTLSQFSLLFEKLQKQPFGLAALGETLAKKIENYQRDNFVLDLGAHKLNLGSRTHIMGIVNLTDDSFSGDGLLKSAAYGPQPAAYDAATQMIDDGADIIDVGGQSSRPGAKTITAKEEIKRTVPIIKKLAKKIKKPISIDTYKPEVAKAALDSGALIINDITGLRNPKMTKVAAQYKAGVVIMHMQGSPQTMQKNPRYDILIADIINYLGQATANALNAGVAQEKIIIDPGIGFGKTVEHNLEILNKLSEFKVLGRPILVGLSRKSFLGKILNKAPQERLNGTISACVLAAHNGAKILRVHDVKSIKEALEISDALKQNEHNN